VDTNLHGYAHLAAFHSSDEMFSIFRRYNYLQTRLLLEKQDELRVLESKLDQSDLLATPMSRRRDEARPAHVALLREIETALLSYGNG
jgi:hypothetical protein